MSTYILDDDNDNLCTVVISLMQKGRRELRDEGLDMLTIGMMHLILIWKIIFVRVSPGNGKSFRRSIWLHALRFDQ